MKCVVQIVPERGHGGLQSLRIITQLVKTTDDPPETYQEVNRMDMMVIVRPEEVAIPTPILQGLGKVITKHLQDIPFEPPLDALIRDAEARDDAV